VQPSTTASLPIVTVAPAFVDGAAATGARLSAIGNPTLKPERQTELESGADLDLLRDRVHLEATVYNRLSRDALINRPVASEFGIVSRQENIGSVRNRGVEGMLSVTAVDNAAVNWNLSLSGSENHNKLEEIGPGIAFIGVNPSNRNKQGYPLVSQFAQPILSYADANGNGIIEDAEITVGDTMVFIGPTSAPRQFVVATALTLFGGRVRLSTQFDHRGGAWLTNFAEINRCSPFVNDCRGVNDPTASLEEQASAVAVNSVRLGRTRFGLTQDGTFTRWRELAAAWTLPESVARRAGARSADVTITARNLRLFTRMPTVDPETNDAVGVVEGYGGNATPPPARYWLLRINLGL
jgi:hypothetical protein